MVLKAKEPKVKALEGKRYAAMLVPSSDGNVVRQAGRGDLQGMVPTYAKRFGKPLVGDRPRLEPDGRTGAVQDGVLPSRTSAFLFQHELKAKTHADDWFAATPTLVDAAGFRVVGGSSGARRKSEDTGFVFLGQRGGLHAIRHANLAEFTQEMFEVSGEGVAMIDEQYHCKVSKRA